MDAGPVLVSCTYGNIHWSATDGTGQHLFLRDCIETCVILNKIGFVGVVGLAAISFSVVHKCFFSKKHCLFSDPDRKDACW